MPTTSPTPRRWPSWTTRSRGSFSIGLLQESEEKQWIFCCKTLKADFLHHRVCKGLALKFLQDLFLMKHHYSCLRLIMTIVCPLLPEMELLKFSIKDNWSGEELGQRGRLADGRLDLIRCMSASIRLLNKLNLMCCILEQDIMVLKLQPLMSKILKRRISSYSPFEHYVFIVCRTLFLAWSRIYLGYWVSFRLVHFRGSCFRRTSLRSSFRQTKDSGGRGA